MCPGERKWGLSPPTQLALGQEAEGTCVFKKNQLENSNKHNDTVDAVI